VWAGLLGQGRVDDQAAGADHQPDPFLHQTVHAATALRLDAFASSAVAVAAAIPTPYLAADRGPRIGKGNVEGSSMRWLAPFTMNRTPVPSAQNFPMTSFFGRLVLAVSGHIQSVPTQLLFVDDNLSDPAGDLSTPPTIYDTARQPIDAYLLCRERLGRPRSRRILGAVGRKPATPATKG
jgi:hypothetical protein